MAQEKVLDIVKASKTILTPYSIEANRIKSNSQIEVNDLTSTYGQRLVTAGSIGYLQSGKLDRDVTDQKLMLSGWYGTDLSYLRLKLASGTNPQVAWGSSNYDILHRGNMPTPEDISAMAIYDRPVDNDCDKAVIPGNYGVFSTTANTPYGTGPSGSQLLVMRWGPSALSQMFFSYTADRTFVRRMQNGTWMPWCEFYTSGNKQPVGGMGLGVGDSPNLLTVTGNVRDFNLAKTNGIFTVEGSWSNGITNISTAAAHTGTLEIKQRAFDNYTVQTYSYWITAQGVTNLAQMRRIWINDTTGWSPWLPCGDWESVGVYRAGILRRNNEAGDDSIYPYVSYAKEKYRDTLAAGVGYTIGEVSFRVGTANKYDPHSGDQLGRILGMATNTTTTGEYDGGLFLASRLRRTDGTVADSSTVSISRTVGTEFTHGGKKVQVNTGNVTAENFYQNTAQDTAINALTRVDFVRTTVSNAVAGSLSSIIPLGSSVDLDTVKTAGFYSQSGNVNATAANHYPVGKAGNLVVTVSAGVIQKYWVYNSSEVWSRAQYAAGSWTTWVRDYNEAFKPTAADVGTLTTAQINTALGLKADTTYVNSEILKQVSKTGDTMTGALTTTQVIATNNYAFVSSLSNTHGLYLGNTASDKRTIVGGGNGIIGTVYIRPMGIGVETNQTIFNTDGTITNGATPTAPSHLTNKLYVDGKIATCVPLAGGIMNTGAQLSFPDGGVRFYNGANTHFWVGARRDSNFAISTGPTFATSNDRFVIDATGNTTAAGVVRGQMGVLADGLVRILSNASGNSILEYHNPGVAASMIYMTSGGQLRFVNSNGSGTESFVRVSIDPNGTLNAAGNVRAPAFVQTSDIRLKSNLVKIDNPLQRCAAIDTYAYDKNGKREVGVVAQDIERALPEAVETVHTENGDYLGVNYGSIASLAVAAINELNQQVKELRDEVEMLKAS